MTIGYPHGADFTGLEQRGLMTPRKAAPPDRKELQRRAVEDIKRAKAALKEARERYAAYDRGDGEA